eukprot:Gb_25037 [translate_table: standard]
MPSFLYIVQAVVLNQELYKVAILYIRITALELAHGYASFSWYPPMNILNLRLHNTPPGINYERDENFSKSGCTSLQDNCVRACSCSCSCSVSNLSSYEGRPLVKVSLSVKATSRELIICILMEDSSSLFILENFHITFVRNHYFPYEYMV